MIEVNWQKMTTGAVVSVLAFYSNDLSSNPYEAYSFL